MSAPSLAAKPERRRLTFSLRTFLIVTLGLSLVLGIAGRAWLKMYRGSQQPTMKELIAIARRHGLPTPPKNAQLVLAITKDASGHAPGFVLEEREDGSAVLLIGGDEVLIQGGEGVYQEYTFGPPYEAPLPRLFSPGQTSLLCAIQVADRTNNAQASELLLRACDEDRWQRRPTGEPHSLRVHLAECLYEYHERRIITHPQQWPETLERLEDLLAEFPQIAHASRRWLIQDLAAAISAKPPQPGSTEALLLDWSQRSCETYTFGIYYEELRGDANEPAREIVLRGKAAIPELIALRGDSRISARRDRQGYILRVGGLAQCLLEQMTTLSRYAGEHPTTVAEWQAWWQREGKVDERTFFMTRVYSRWEGRIVEVHDGPAQILAERYPETMPQLCSEFLQLAEPRVQPFTLTEALAIAKLPHARRLQLLEDFVWRGPLGERYFALRQFAAANRERCNELVLRLLEKVPDDATLPYWNRPEAACLHIVVELDDPQVWRAYRRIAERSSVALRLQMLLPLGGQGRDENRAQRLAFLATFLDDDSIRIRDKESPIEGPTAAFDFPEIAIRDFAAWQIADILGLAANPDPSWSPEQWSGLRDRVRARLKREKLAFEKVEESHALEIKQ